MPHIIFDVSNVDTYQWAHTYDVWCNNAYNGPSCALSGTVGFHVVVMHAAQVMPEIMPGYRG